MPATETSVSPNDPGLDLILDTRFPGVYESTAARKLYELGHDVKAWRLETCGTTYKKFKDRSGHVWEHRIFCGERFVCPTDARSHQRKEITSYEDSRPTSPTLTYIELIHPLSATQADILAAGASLRSMTPHNFYKLGARGNLVMSKILLCDPVTQEQRTKLFDSFPGVRITLRTVSSYHFKTELIYLTQPDLADSMTRRAELEHMLGAKQQFIVRGFRKARRELLVSTPEAITNNSDNPPPDELPTPTPRGFRPRCPHCGDRATHCTKEISIHEAPDDPVYYLIT